MPARRLLAVLLPAVLLVAARPAAAQDTEPQTYLVKSNKLLEVAGSVKQHSCGGGCCEGHDSTACVGVQLSDEAGRLLGTAIYDNVGCCDMQCPPGQTCGIPGLGHSGPADSCPNNGSRFSIPVDLGFLCVGAAEPFNVPVRRARLGNVVNNSWTTGSLCSANDPFEPYPEDWLSSVTWGGFTDSCPNPTNPDIICVPSDCIPPEATLPQNAKAEIVSPTHNEFFIRWNTPNVLLRWRRAGNSSRPDSYRVVVYGETAVHVDVRIPCETDECTHEVSLPVEPASYYWWVQPITASVEGRQSRAGAFNLNPPKKSCAGLGGTCLTPGDPGDPQICPVNTTSVYGEDCRGLCCAPDCSVPESHDHWGECGKVDSCGHVMGSPGDPGCGGPPDTESCGGLGGDYCSSTVDSCPSGHRSLGTTRLNGAVECQTCCASNKPPRANGQIQPTSRTKEFSFDGSGSSDPDGTIVGYDWDFGDGAHAPSAQATHRYAAAGRYTVRLVVTDNAGATATWTGTVDVPEDTIGYLDGADGFRALGWACDRNDFNAALAIDIYVDGPAGTGQLLGTTIANRPREAAVGNLCGDGHSNHGYELPFPASLRNGQTHSIYAYARYAATTALLTGAPITAPFPVDPSLVVLTASYVPSPGAPRTSGDAVAGGPPLHFFYNEALGNYAQRPGASCHQGQDNPTYFKIRVQVPALQSCRIQASWDAAPIPCTQPMIESIASGQWITLNSDAFAMDFNTCAPAVPPSVVLPVGQPGWLTIDLGIGGQTFTRRIDFQKDRYYASAYNVGAWSTCGGSGSYTCTSASPTGCARTGAQTRSVNESAWTLDAAQAAPRPAASQACTQTAPGYIAGYSVGAWGACSGTTQTRAVTPNAWKPDAPSVAAPANTRVCDSAVVLTGSYVPSPGAPRTSVDITAPSAPLVRFHYDEARGNFEQKPGGPCHQGQSNPTYFTVRVQVPALQSCRVQASWDAAPITCTPAMIDGLASGQWITLNTDTFATNPATCSPAVPQRPILAMGQPGWFKIDIVINGETYTRRIDFQKSQFYASAYNVGAWSACTGSGSYTCTSASATGCGRPGTQTRSASESAWTPDPALAVPRPPTSQACTQAAPGYVAGFAVGGWGTCSDPLGGTQSRAVTPNAWKPDAPSVAAPVATQPCDASGLVMIASYVASNNGPRISFDSASANPPALTFFYDQARGNFEQKPGGACHQGQDNPTYLKIRFQGPPIEACSLQASWDPTPTPCVAPHVAFVNSGQWLTLNTESLATNPATCALQQPPQAVLPAGQVGWFKLDYVIGGRTYTRRINFIKNVP